MLRSGRLAATCQMERPVTQLTFTIPYTFCCRHRCTSAGWQNGVRVRIRGTAELGTSGLDSMAYVRERKDDSETVWVRCLLDYRAFPCAVSLQSPRCICLAVCQALFWSRESAAMCRHSALGLKSITCQAEQVRQAVSCAHCSCIDAPRSLDQTISAIWLC